MNPNGPKQLWSKWTFYIREAAKSPTYEEVDLNVRKWISRGFGHAGTVRVSRTVLGWRIEALMEGPPAHDPGFVASVRQHFQKDFVEAGFGIFATSEVETRIVAGDKEDGKPRPQMVMLQKGWRIEPPHPSSERPRHA